MRGFYGHSVETLLTETSKISYGNSFELTKNIVDTFTSKELHNICNGEFKESPYIIYREILLVNKDPAAFIDIYSIPEEMEDDEAAIVVGCKKKYRGSNYIQQLVKRAITKLKKQKKIKKLYWETTKSNSTSSHIASKLGFKKSEDINKDDDNYLMLMESAILSEDSDTTKYKDNFKSKKPNFEHKSIPVNSPEAKKYIKSDKLAKKNEQYLSENTGEFLIDTTNDKLIGYIWVGDKKDKGFISTLYINKEYRGYGFGEILLKDAIDKYNAIDLVVYKDNKVALEMYKKFGFVPISETRNNKAYWMKLKDKLSKDEKII